MCQKHVLLLVPVIAFALLPPALSGEQELATKEDPLVRRVTHSQWKKESVVAIINALGREAKVSVAIEDVPRAEWSSLTALRVDYATNGETLKESLDGLMKKTEAFSWQSDANTINVVDAALKKDNPFDEKVEPFKFKGRPCDFLSLMNSKVKPLEAMQLSVALGGDDDAEVSLETRESMTLRQAFNRFSNQAGLRWHARVGEPPPPAGEPIVRTKEGFTGGRVASRTIVTFLPAHP